MVTEANTNLSDGHRVFGVCEDAVNVPAHVLCGLLVEFLKSQLSQSGIEDRLILSKVTVEVSTDDSRFIRT